MPSFLEVTNLAKSYSVPNGGTISPVFTNLNLSLERGQSKAIVGPSGSGKSSLLNLISGLDRPSAGKIRIEGKSISDLSLEDSARFRNQTIGFVFQSHHLIPSLTALENVMIPALAGHGKSGRRELCAEACALLAKVGLEGRLDYLPSQLSGGECQRVAIARALINEPKLVLADEPTGSLDHANAQDFADLLLLLGREVNLSILAVTHSLKFANRMDEVWSLEGGVLKLIKS